MSIVYFQANSSCCTFYKFGQTVMSRIHYHSATQSVSTALENPLCSVCSSPRTPATGKHGFLKNHIHDFAFPERQVVGIILYVAFLSLNNIHLMFLHVFYGFIAYSFLVLNHILLRGHTTVHPLNAILVASKCWHS